MAVKTESVEKNLVKLTFEVSPEKFEKTCNDIYKKSVGKFNIRGYRKGKVPKAIIDKLYPGVFYDEALNRLLPEAYEAALEESKLDVVVRPAFDVEPIEKGKPIVFTALVTTKPIPEIGQYKNVEIENISSEVTDEDVMKAIDAEREKNARMIDVDDRPVQKGDFVILDFDGSIDGVPFDGGKAEDYSLEIGSGTFIEGFEDQLVGAEIDKEVDVKVTFPENYHAEEMSGKDAVFKCVIKGIQVKELPEADDDFAEEVSEFDTLEEYKADLKAKMIKQAEDSAKSMTETAVIDAVVKNASVDVPEAMIEARVDERVAEFERQISVQGLNLETYLSYIGKTVDELKEEFKGIVEREIKTSLVIEAIMHKEGIEANDEELETELARRAKARNTSVDEYKAQINDDVVSLIRENVAMQKTVDMLVNNAVVKDAAPAEDAAE